MKVRCVRSFRGDLNEGMVRKGEVVDTTPHRAQLHVEAGRCIPCSQGNVNDEKGPAETMEDGPKDHGIRHIGGPWFEVIVDGEVIDKVRGSEKAREVLDAHTESTD